MDTSLFVEKAIPGCTSFVDGFEEPIYLPVSYQNKRIVTANEVARDGLVFIMNWDEGPSTFYPMKNLKETSDFTRCIGCKGGGCKNKVVRPVDLSIPRADFNNYRVEECGAA